MSLVTSPVNDPQEQFRMRSKSLDVSYNAGAGHHILNDCDATYKIFDKIVREGIFVVGILWAVKEVMSVR